MVGLKVCGPNFELHLLQNGSRAMVNNRERTGLGVWGASTPRVAAKLIPLSVLGLTEAVDKGPKIICTSVATGLEDQPDALTKTMRRERSLELGRYALGTCEKACTGGKRKLSQEHQILHWKKKKRSLKKEIKRTWVWINERQKRGILLEVFCIS